MEHLQGNTITIGQLLSQEFFFRVPEYQRPFSWDQDNFDDLIDDMAHSQGLPRLRRVGRWLATPQARAPLPTAFRSTVPKNNGYHYCVDDERLSVSYTADPGI